MKLIAIFTTVLLTLLLPGITAQANTAKPDIYIAVRAHAGAGSAVKKWGPTVDYLNQVLPDYHFVMLPYTSLKQQIADAKAKKYHLLLTNPSTYIELEVSKHARAMLTLVNNRRGTAQTRFGSVIFTHVNNTNIIELADLKGKHVMAVTPIGFGGWRVGLKVLLDHGIKPESDFHKLSFAGKQPKVVAAVLNRKADAGVVRTDMLERLADKGEIDLRQVRVLNQQSTPGFPFFHSTPLYPEWPFATMSHTSPELAEQVKQALLQIDKTHPAAQAGMYMGWTEALDYQSVKNLLADIGVEPFAKNWFKQLPYVLPIFILLLIAFFIIKRYSSKKKMFDRHA